MWGAEILREYSSPTMCHMSRLMSHMSLFWGVGGDNVVELVCEGSVINGAYPV